MLEIIQMIPIPIERGNRTTGSIGGFGSVPPMVQKGSQRTKDGPPVAAHAKQNSDSQAPKVVDDSDKFTKETFIKLKLRNSLEV